MWRLFLELVCAVAEILGMNADELLKKKQTNQRQKQ